MTLRSNGALYLGTDALAEVTNRACLEEDNYLFFVDSKGVFEEVRGTTTINTNDDGYAIQKFDTEFHRGRVVEADESLDARRCNRVIFEPGFHAKKGSQVVAATEYNCQDAVCPANCEDPIFNDGARLAVAEDAYCKGVNKVLYIVTYLLIKRGGLMKSAFLFSITMVRSYEDFL